MFRPLAAMPVLMAILVSAFASHAQRADAEVPRQRITSIGHVVTLECNPETAHVGQQQPIKLASPYQFTPAGTVVTISYYETLAAPPPVVIDPPLRQRVIATQPGGTSSPHKKTITWQLKRSLVGRQVEQTTIMAAQCITAAYIAPATP